MTTSKTNTRSGRSNSLQRMLELEKQCMFERHHPYSPPKPPSPKAQPPVVIATKNSPRVQSSIQARRAKGTMQTNMRPSSSHETRPDRAKAPQLPPLVINTGTSIMMSPPDLLKVHGRESSPMASSIVSTPNDKYAKVVSFEFPPTESEAAPCHSPSWEAYERRKTEKKTEKREREESRNGRTKRLVKAPPTSSVYSLQQAAASDVEANRGRQRERPGSSTSCNTPNMPPRKARSRSNSFVSMLRAPFDFRRQSVDHTQDAGFIGGIKLEIQRQSITQQVLDRQVAADEANVHPALRKGKVQNRRWSSPLKSPPPPPRAGVDGGEDERRYPPITRGRNVPYTAASLISPTAPAIPDLGTIEKWRAKVGWKSIPRADAGMNPSHDAQSNLAGAAADLKQTISSRMEMKPTKVKRPSSPLPPKPTHFECPPMPHPREKMVESKPKLDSSNNMSISSCMTDETYKTAPPPTSSPPPEPPRRSSKRNSVLSISDSIPPLPSPPQQYASAQSSPVREANPPRSFALCGDRLQPNNTSKDQAVGVAVPLNQTSLMLSSTGFAQLPSSSSEDSGSDDFHSTSIFSTPATSRPQSENGISLETTNGEPPMIKNRNRKPRLSLPNTTYPLHSTENSDDEAMDPIQAAAEKVLAVFNDIPVHGPSLRRRSNSQATLSVDACFDAPLRERPLKLHPKTASGVPLQNPTSPACYLEEARKQPPSVLVHRTRKQRLGPPASFIIPDSDSDTTASEKHMSTGPDVVGRSLRHKSTPLLSMSDREPIAKVFVECCSCKYYHDMPSNLYEAMANPDSVLSPTDGLGCEGALSMTVKCPWCKHEMSMRCCAGLAATVYIKERLH